MGLASDLRDALKRRVDGASKEEAKQWFEDHRERLDQLASNDYLRRYLFEPFTGLLDSFGKTTEGQVKQTITQVALANGVLAGLPGKLGVGVAVSMALEAWMAYRVASHIGIRIDKPGDIFKCFGVVASVFGIVFFGFVHILRGIFSLLAALPVNVPATFAAELIATDIVGVLFWVMFDAARRDGKAFRKSLDISLLSGALAKTKALVGYQWQGIKDTLNPANIALVATRLRGFLTGDSPPPDPPRLRGEVLASAAWASLANGRAEAFDGPLGRVFLQSIRDRWSEVDADASAEEIVAFMQARDYTPEQMEGVISNIKGKMFEHLFAMRENADGDEWIARLHDGESHPGSDVVLTDLSTGREIELSLKATADPALIEHALLKYPMIDIVTSSELSDRYEGHERVSSVGIDSSELDRIARTNLESMAQSAASRVDTVEALAIGAVGVRFVLLWPLTVRYLRGKINAAELQAELVRALGVGGKVLAKRLALGLALGPVYAWYLLARGVMELTPTVREGEATRLRLEYVGLGVGAKLT